MIKDRKEKFIDSLIGAYKEEEVLMLLDSQMKTHPASTTSFLAFGFDKKIEVFGNECRITDGGSISVESGNIFDILNKFHSESRSWLFGYLGYDLKNEIENLSSTNTTYIDFPDALLFSPKTIVEINQDGDYKVLKGSIDFDKLDESYSDNEGNVFLKLKKSESEANYISKIKKAQDFIKEGDFYEINLSHPIEFEFRGEAWHLYKKMKEVGAVPFASYLKLDDKSVCSASPERFLSRKNGELCSQPIKGTISRSSKNEIKKIKALQNNEKERAENLMIVDLVRNDLNRIAIKGSVRVKDLFQIQTFETVHQMVSTVCCDVEDSTSSFDIIKSCFPMGSMTGAPKIAAMKAIEELEDYKRGIYSGAMGYLKPNGDFDFNVVIRTAQVEGDTLIYPVGGAITSDSIPEKEWEETWIKARALINIIK